VLFDRPDDGGKWRGLMGGGGHAEQVVSNYRQMGKENAQTFSVAFNTRRKPSTVG
jgi:hypothetical protein